MRTEQEMFRLILSVAQADERIRAVFLNGSRANPGAEPDPWRDYDIVFSVTAVEPMVNDPTWLRPFGKPCIVQEPDSVDYAWGANLDLKRGYTWLMLFPDGVRIDLHIEAMEVTLRELGRDSLTVLLLDKDGALPALPPASDKGYWVSAPSLAQYNGCCNEFWWCLNNVAKGIVRDQLSYSMWMLNTVVRDMLTKMLAWHCAMAHDFRISVGMEGKYFKKYLPVPLYEKLAHTYPSEDYPAMWEGIFTMCDLFSQTARAVGEQLGFPYRQDWENGMRAYLATMKLQWQQRTSQ